MSNEEFTYEITANASGEKFYNGGPIIGIAAVLSIESEQTAVAGKIVKADSALSFESNLTALAGLIQTVSSILSIDGATVVVGIYILKALVIADASVDLSATSLAIRYAIPATQTGNLSTNITSLKIIKAAVNLDSNLNTTINAKIIKLLSANLSGSSLFVLLAGEILLLKANLSIVTGLVVADILRITSTSRFPGSIVSLIVLDDKPLTAQNRNISYDVGQVKVEKINWNSKKSRYYKSSTPNKMVVKIGWEWLPSKKYETFDKREARDYIREIASDMNSHILKIISYGTNPQDLPVETSYNVFVKSYTEDIVRRDLTQNVYFYKCDLELEEV